MELAVTMYMVETENKITSILLNEIDVQLHRDIANYPFKLLSGVWMTNKVTLRSKGFC